MLYEPSISTWGHAFHSQTAASSFTKWPWTNYVTSLCSGVLAYKRDNGSTYFEVLLRRPK